jgi:hypothetical protein
MSVRLQDDLLKHLERNGWSVTRQKEGLEWWAHEIWMLASQWSPHGLTLFLTFLTDPEPGNPNPFWIIGTSWKHPENRSEACGEPSLKMSPTWIQDLPQFVAGLNALRQANPENG